MEEKTQADLIYQKQEESIRMKDIARKECLANVRSRFLSHISSFPAHNGSIDKDLLRDWMSNHEECAKANFDLKWNDFPFDYPTLGGRISYEDHSWGFKWKISK